MTFFAKLPPELSVGGSGGGSSSSESEMYVPYEAANSLQANTIAMIQEAVVEGVIAGPANDNNWYKSTYLNETQLMADDGTMNFNGVKLVATTGTPNQDYLPGHDGIESETLVATQVTHAGGPLANTISNSGIDDVRVTIQTPRMAHQNDKGDVSETRVDFRITVTPANGAGTEQTVVDDYIHGKCVTPYRESRRIRNLSQYGAAPWIIKVYRDTEDSTSSKLQNTTEWYSYTEIINVKLRYPDTVMVGLEINAREFGNRLPSRIFKLKGRLIQYPSNYNPTTRQYTGIWDGTFVTGYCNNPAWVLYDMLTNTRYGVGLSLAYTDKWALYSIGQYCDGSVTYKKKTQQANGSYTTEEVTGPRYEFNGVIQDRKEALAVIAHMCSVFMGLPCWTSGMLSFVQDAPKAIDRKAHPSNVEDAFFEYEGTELGKRTTVVRVSFNDPDNFGRPKIVTEVDSAGIVRYGYNPVDIVAFCCYSEAEAVRHARHVLDTNLRLTDQVSFVGGLEWADVSPGEITGVEDPTYTNKNLYGRIVSSTATSVEVDRDIEIEAGITYTLFVPDSESKTLFQKTLTNTPGTTRNLTWSGDVNPAPQPGFDFVISCSDKPLRQFEVIGITETDDIKYGITGIEYDPDKYDRIETGIVIEEAPQPGIPIGKMPRPDAIVIQPTTYTEGDQDIRKYGMLISWDAVDDPRCQVYEVIASFNDGGWYQLGMTSQTSFDYRDAASGTYDIAVRAKGVAAESNWRYKNDYVLGTGLKNPAPPTGLHCVDDPVNEYFKGPDCEISWAASTGSDFNIPADPEIPFDGDIPVGASNIVGYKIEVYNGTDLKRTHISNGQDVLSWAYTLAMNAEDNGNPIRNINFRVYTMAQDGDTKLPSLTYASLSASNPAPSMSSQIPTILPMAGHLDISWTRLVNDNDMLGYEIQVDGAKQGMVGKATDDFRFHDVEVGTTYTIQIIPHDEFGPGTGSQTNHGSPVKIPAVNLDVELSSSIERTDSDGNSAATLEKLYDGEFGANGIAYTVSGTDKYIQYKYGLQDYFDRIAVWADDANARVYAAFSEDGQAWSFFKADTDHTVDSGKMTLATDQNDAKTNYWQLGVGQNVALLPNNLVAKYARLYLTGTYTTTIYEFVPSRIVISELGAIKYLSSFIADFGLIKAGRIESANGQSYFDLDNNQLQIGAGSSGYGNLSDKPILSNSGALWPGSNWSQSGLSSFNASLVNDGSIVSNAFHTDNAGVGSFLKLDTVTGKNFTSVAIYTNSVWATWDVQYSDNNADWVSVASGLGGYPNLITGWSFKAWIDAGSHRYWRLKKTDAAHGGSYHKEVQFYEGVSGTNDADLRTGKTTIIGDTITVYDASNNVRVKIGDLS